MGRSRAQIARFPGSTAPLKNHAGAGAGRGSADLSLPSDTAFRVCYPRKMQFALIPKTAVVKASVTNSLVMLQGPAVLLESNCH